MWKNTPQCLQHFSFQKQPNPETDHITILQKRNKWKEVSPASRLALTQKSPASRLAADLTVSCQPAYFLVHLFYCGDSGDLPHVVGLLMAIKNHFFSLEPSQSLGWTKLFTSYKPKTIDHNVLFVFCLWGVRWVRGFMVLQDYFTFFFWAEPISR